MPLSRLLRKLSRPNLVPPATTDTESILSTDNLNDSPQSSEPTRTVSRSWRRKRTLTSRSNISRQPSTPPFSPNAEHPLDKPLPPQPSVLLTKLAIVSSPDVTPVGSSPVEDKLTQAWNAVKDNAMVAKMSQQHTVGMYSLPRVLFCINLVLAFR